MWEITSDLKESPTDLGPKELFDKSQYLMGFWDSSSVSGPSSFADDSFLSLLFFAFELSSFRFLESPELDAFKIARSFNFLTIKATKGIEISGKIDQTS